MLFLTLSPFAAFALLMVTATSQISLIVAASLSLALLIADRLRGRSLKTLQLGAAIAFTGLALYVSLIDRGLSPHWIRAAINLTMLALGLGSLLFGSPLTMQYARETVTPDVAARTDFLRVNVLITWVWCGACVAMLAANFAACWRLGCRYGRGLRSRLLHEAVRPPSRSGMQVFAASRQSPATPRRTRTEVRP